MSLSLPNTRFSRNSESGIRGAYWYGFQAQEQDNEMWSGSVTYKYRVEDPRLGRFFCVDPMTKNYSHNSPFSYCQNSVILFRELEGCEAYYAGDGSFITSFGTDNTMRVICDMEVVKEVKLSPEKYMPDWFYSNSVPARFFDCSENFHQRGVDAVNLGAALYAILSQKTQDAELKEGYAQASWLLKCFATGVGPKMVMFSESDGLTKMINKDDQLLKEVASDFKAVLNSKFAAEKDGFEKAITRFFEGTQDFKGGYEFSPDHTSFADSFEKHLSAISENPIDFVIGGMSYTMTPVKNKQGSVEGFQIVFTNTMGKESLFLHRANDLPQTKYSVGLESIDMKFTFYITKEEMLNFLKPSSE